MTELDWGTPPATVLDVHDGDTITVDADRGLETHRNPIALRLHDASCPELKQAGGEAAHARTLELCPPGSTVLIRTFKTKSGRERETLGRYVADIYYRAGAAWVSLAETLIAEGHARPGAFMG